MPFRESPLSQTFPDNIPRFQPPQPKLSAGVIPFRTAPSGECEIYWVRRSKSLRFMGGWNSFPGGRLAATDSSLVLQGSLRGGRAYRSSGPKAAHAACALRELFEETGILVVSGTLPSAAEIERARLQLLEEDLDLGAWLAEHRLVLDASPLHYAGRWVTPPLSRIRFDATFFLLEWTAARPIQPRVIPGELAWGEWIPAASALLRWEDGGALLAQPTLETLRVLADHGPAGCHLLWRSQAHQPNSPHSIEFRPLVRVIPLASRTLPPATHTNAVLLGGKSVVLVDPGAEDEEELGRLREIVDAETQRTGGQLTAIWLSHHHVDHVSGAEAIRRHYGVPVLCHPATAERLSGSGLRISGHIEDGDVFDLPGRPPLRVRALHTPGHASGHLCFLEERSRTLLGGDMLSGFSTVVISPPDGSMAQYIESLEKVRALRPEVILPSHGTMIPNPVQSLEKAIRHRLQREERVRETWRNGLHTPEEMVQAVYGDLHPAVHPIAARQVLAHLERLAQTGRIGSLPPSLLARLGRS